MIDDRTQVLVWADEGDFEAFEEALIKDPTVNIVELKKAGERRLYRFILTNEGAKNDMYPQLVNDGGFIRQLTGSNSGMEVRCNVSRL